MTSKNATTVNGEPSDCVADVHRLMTLVESIVKDSGDPLGFDAEAWTAQWFETPCPALGGRKPVDFMNTADGRELIAGLIRQMQSGAYA